MGYEWRTLIVGWVIVPISVLSAQLPDPPRPASPDRSDPYARYIRPGACTQAVLRFDARYWRDRRPDTVVYAPASATFPASALQAGRECAAHFSIATTPARDLLSLTQLYLWTGQDTLADAAAARLLTVEATHRALDRGWTLFQLVSSALDARPVRESVVRQYLARLNALDDSASPWKLMAHTAAARYAMSIGNIDMAIQESSAAVTAASAMDQHDQMDRMPFVMEGYMLLAEARAAPTGGRAGIAVLDTALQRLLPVVGNNQSEAMSFKSMIDFRQKTYALLDREAPPLTAAYWFPSEAGTATQPARGEVSLVVSVHANCEGRCFGMYATIRRLHDKYHAAGLQIILLTSTEGYFHQQPISNPPAEVEKIRSYFMDFLKLPGTLAINEASLDQQPDGRHSSLAAQAQRDYFFSGNAAVVGKDGTFRMITNLSPESEAMLAGSIARALRGR